MAILLYIIEINSHFDRLTVPNEIWNTRRIGIIRWENKYTDKYTQKRYETWSEFVSNNIRIHRYIITKSMSVVFFTVLNVTVQVWTMQTDQNSTVLIWAFLMKVFQKRLKCTIRYLRFYYLNISVEYHIINRELVK